ncbi:hypothetical protein TW85_19910 [Marinomonas sp. S3726]|uniref:leucine-rich repeat domain-containing protein n=1 Tax=Marinomonas sp. S3726 TaxID=579484 RepID=UPI0005FA2F15|nr:leucine-rich repeat domain-containing protein [Marinomonas sp. S3726]KJZ10516.1 hypothetical protein TW85_19910 [Marinomonas sp. S3726]
MFLRLVQYCIVFGILSACSSENDSSSSSATDSTSSGGSTDLPLDDIPTVKIDSVLPVYSNLDLNLNAVVGNIKSNQFSYEWKQTGKIAPQASFKSGKNETSTTITLPNSNYEINLSFALDVIHNNKVVTSEEVIFTLLPNPRISDLGRMKGIGLQQCLDGYLRSEGWVYMSEVTTLDCGFRALDTLVGIEQFLELRTFSDDYGDPLTDHDLYILSQLPSLEFLGIRDREVNNLALVSNFDSPFSALKTLDLINTSLSDLKWVTLYPNLEAIMLDGNMITDFSPLTSLTNLEEVWLGGHSRNDQLDFAGYDVLESLKHLTKLTLYYTKNTDIQRISRLENITDLALNGTDVTDISSLANLNNLESLQLYYVDSNFSSQELKSLNTVTKLELYGSDIPLSDISKMSLETLFLDTMKLDNIDDLKGMAGLKNLKISTNNLKDISALESLVGLTKLNLKYNQIEDISSLAKLSDLEELDLSDNEVEDISPLYSLQKLKTLDLSGLNKITCYQINELMGQTPTLVIKDTTSCS